MVVALKSLPAGTKLNIVGFGNTIKPLFTSSKQCTDVSITTVDTVSIGLVLYFFLPNKKL